MIRKEEENVERKMSMWLNEEGVRAPCKIFAKVLLCDSDVARFAAILLAEGIRH
jgi:hypothetical protein